jgi:Flp pilus assembly protein TadD
LSHAFARVSPLLLILLLAGCAGTGGPRPADGKRDAGAPVEPATARAFEAGLGHLRAERYAEAAAVFERLVQARPDLPGPHANLGIAYARLEREQEAVAALEAAVELDAANAEAHNELGILHREAGRFAPARSHYEQALASRPDYAIAHRNLGILCDIYLQDLRCAADHYQRYQQLVDGGDRQAEIWLADIERRIGEGGG